MSRVIVLILSVESAPGLDPLPDTNDGARRFRDAVLSFQNDAEVVWCASPKPADATHEATLPAIFDVLTKRMRSSTGWVALGVERIYAFVSGHGAASDTGAVLATGDGQLLAVSELQESLQRQLGAGVHHWFFDLCRLDDDAEPPELPDFSANNPAARALRSELWSAEPGHAAGAQSGFGPAVADGLEGAARGWHAEPGGDAPSLLVSSEGLADFVEERIRRRFPGQAVHDDAGRRSKRLREYGQPCELVPLAFTGVRGRVKLSARRGAGPIEEDVVPPARIDVAPDVYAVESLTPGVWVSEPRVNLLPPAERPSVELAEGLAPIQYLEALPDDRAASDRFFTTRRTEVGRRWLRSTRMDAEPDPHLSERLRGIALDPVDAPTGNTLAMVAVTLGGGFEILDRAAFGPRPDGPGVFVALDGRAMGRSGVELVLEDAAGIEVGRGQMIGGAAAGTSREDVPPASGFIPLPATIEDWIRLRIETSDGYVRVILVPVAPDAVTVLYNLDLPLQADQRVAIVPLHGDPGENIQLAGRQLLAQYAARNGMTFDGSPLPPFPTTRSPAARGAAIVHAAFGSQSLRVGVPSIQFLPYEPWDYPWLSAAWTDLERAGDPRLPAAPGGRRLWRSPLATWRVKSP